VSPYLSFETSVRELWDVPLPDTIPRRHRAVFTMLCCWSLWKHRNAVIFEGLQPCLRRLLRACADEAHLWAYRLTP
jgi:hypothetical protein